MIYGIIKYMRVSTFFFSCEFFQDLLVSRKQSQIFISQYALL